MYLRFSNFDVNKIGCGGGQCCISSLHTHREGKKKCCRGLGFNGRVADCWRIGSRVLSPREALLDGPLAAAAAVADAASRVPTLRSLPRY